jgi:hypothetical protein
MGVIMKKALIVVLSFMFVVAGVFATTPQASAAPYCGITWGSLPKHGGGMSTVPLTNIRTGQHECYDRMVFDFSGSASGYRVEYVTNVYADGSGQLISLNGGAKLQIIALASAYDTNGSSTYPGIVGKHLPGINLSGYQTFRDAKFAGSFEGQTTVGLGVRARLPFRIFTLNNRLVVDVAHRW